MKKHRGIRIDAIPVKTAMGFVFVVAVLAIFLIGIPATRGFLALGIIGGLVVGIILFWWRHQTRW